MKKFLFAIFTLSTFVFASICFAGEYTFSDNKHTAWVKSDEHYALADKMLNETWKTVKSSLSADENAKLLANQKEWIANGRTVGANRYFPQLTEVEAFTQSAFDRIVYLDSLVPPKFVSGKYKYEYFGEAQITLGMFMTVLSVQTVTETAHVCDLSYEIPNDDFTAGWNFFEGNSPEEGIIAVFLLNNSIYISQTYLTGNDPSHLPAAYLCGTSGFFEGKYILVER